MKNKFLYVTDISQNLYSVDYILEIGVFKFSANITGPGSLQRIPILPQNVSQSQAINLKIQNPINLRLTGQQANLIQGGKSGAAIIGQRPTMLINAAQLRPIQG